MLTYQIRSRGYRSDDPVGFLFPNIVEVNFEMSPQQPFGMEPGNGRTAVQAVEGTVSFNANTGVHSIESKQPLQPLDVKIDEDNGRRIELIGNTLKVTFHAQSLNDLDSFVQSIFFAFPILLSVEFADPVIVTQVYGKVGETPFRWMLTYWNLLFDITTQEKQEQRVVDSWHRLEVLSEPSHRRLVAALHYFHVGVRLTRVGVSTWEFMGEAILNFSKVLEVLFPAPGDSQSKDATREGLKRLGYTKGEIERDFIPIIELRNKLDVGHVLLSIFTRSQLAVIHSYTERSESILRGLLMRVTNGVQDGSYTITPYTDLKASRELIKLIDKLDEHLGSHTSTDQLKNDPLGQA